jgi:hypothetical protein
MLFHQVWFLVTYLKLHTDCIQDVEERGGDNTVEVLSRVNTFYEEPELYSRESKVSTRSSRYSF